MESLFKDLAEKWVGTINSIIVEKAETRDYLWRGLRAEYSADMKFSTISGKTRRVTADIIAMDSDIPLKSRESMESFDGEIPKVGMKKYLQESQLKAIQILEALDKPEYTIVQKIFDDYTACVEGPYETLEYQIYSQLSLGLFEIDINKNTGIAVRADIGVPDSHRFGVTKKWSDAGATPIGDIERIVETALEDGITHQVMLLDRKTFNAFRRNAEVKAFYATYRDAQGGSLAIPNLSKVNDMLLEEFGLTITIMERNFVFEKNGTFITAKGWADGQVSFLPSMDSLGTLYWSDLAEANARVEYKTYSFPEPWLMVSTYREGSPLREFTESQGLVAPVLTIADQLFLLDTTEAIVIDAGEIEDDATITIYGGAQTKATVITAMETIGAPVDADVTDADLIAAINELSDEDEAALKAELGI